MSSVIRLTQPFIVAICLSPALLPGDTTRAGTDAGGLVALNVSGTELHYVDSGSGPPLVLVHGGLADYRELSPLAAELRSRYRTIVYSRRHSFPNDNRAPGADGHMFREVADLAGLIESLDVAPAHVAGTSYGGFVALMLALERPDLVRSVIAAEPPLLHWLPGVDGGQVVYDDFDSRVMAPSRAAFAAGRPEQALRVAMDYFVGPGGLDALPQEVRDILLGNIRDWEAITTAPDALPGVTREQVAAVQVPVLLLSGGASAALHGLIDTELFRTLAQGQRVVIDGGTHEMCVEQPGACANAIDRFIGQMQ